MPDAAAGARILVCRPDFFEVSYQINPFMDPGAWAEDADTLTHLARQEWQALHDTFLKVGIDLYTVPPVAGLPDMVFTANAAIVLDGKCLVARFKHPERQGEEAVFLEFFEGLKRQGLVSDVRMMPEGVFQEGAGDCVWDRKREFFWAGYGQRSDEAAARPIAEYFGKEVVNLELATPEFYHMDVSLCPLTNGDILYHPDAFTPHSLGLLKERVEDPAKLIAVERADAEKLAVNSVNVGMDVVMAHAGEALQAQLRERGYTPHIVPLTAFRRSGGAAFCLTLRLDLTSSLSAGPAPAAA